MRIFLVGDSYSGTGPANVTKYYIEYLPKGTLYQKNRSKVMRVPELFVKIAKADVVAFSGYSKQNLLGMKFARFFHRPTAYIMHGCVEYENEINKVPSEEMAAVERKTLEMADLILAVSPVFADWLKEHYSEFKDKIDFVTNGVDEMLLDMADSSREESRDSHIVFSIGGGMPRKMIKYICKAVQFLRESYDDKLKLVVVGDEGADSDEINAYDFVENKGLVPFSETVKLLRTSSVFVQNSCFETFGLAPVEAVACGCPTLLSKNVGALCLFSNIRDEDVIEKYDDPVEISSKIRNLLENPNNEYLNEHFVLEQNTWKIRSRELTRKLENIRK